MEIVEGNKLIAVFMGAKVQADNNDGWWDGTAWLPTNPNWKCYTKEINACWEHIYSASNQFHSSWDWLMPVVEKIEALGFQFFIHNDGCYMRKWFFRGNFPDFGNVAETKIKSVFLLVIEFINWHNQQSGK
jgi:hypothetical protein